jgi:hypothetical protein
MLRWGVTTSGTWRRPGYDETFTQVRVASRGHAGGAQPKPGVIPGGGAGRWNTDRNTGAGWSRGDDEDDPDARATEEAEATKAVSVDVLPGTGSGSSGGSILSYLVILTGAGLVALAAAGSLRHRSPR